MHLLTAVLAQRDFLFEADLDELAASAGAQLNLLLDLLVHDAVGLLNLLVDKCVGLVVHLGPDLGFVPFVLLKLDYLFLIL